MSAKINTFFICKRKKDRHFACLFFLPRILVNQAKSQKEWRVVSGEWRVAILAAGYELRVLK